MFKKIFKRKSNDRQPENTKKRHKEESTEANDYCSCNKCKKLVLPNNGETNRTHSVKSTDIQGEQKIVADTNKYKKRKKSPKYECQNGEKPLIESISEEKCPVRLEDCKPAMSGSVKRSNKQGNKKKWDSEKKLTSVLQKNEFIGCNATTKNTWMIDAAKAVRGCSEKNVCESQRQNPSSYTWNLIPREVIRGSNKCSTRDVSVGGESTTSLQPEMCCSKTRITAKGCHGKNKKSSNKPKLDRRECYPVYSCDTWRKEDTDSIATRETVSKASTPTILQFFRYKSGICPGGKKKPQPCRTVSSIMTNNSNSCCLQESKTKVKSGRNQSCHKTPSKKDCCTDCASIRCCASSRKNLASVCVGRSSANVRTQYHSKGTSCQSCSASNRNNNKRRIKSKKIEKKIVARGTQCKSKLHLCDYCESSKEPVVIFNPSPLLKTVRCN